MRVLIAGGGTAGHINPAISIAKHIKKRRPSSEILFVGAAGGMEEKLVVAAGFPLVTFRMRGFLRSLSPKSVIYNLGALRMLAGAMGRADEIIKDFAPDIIIGTGGFASYPPISRGAKRGIPTLIHESNVLPGRTNRSLARHADRVLLGFEESRKYIDGGNVRFSGNPLRDELIFMKKDEAKAALGTDGHLVYSFWGSLGAREMNKITAALFVLEQEEGFPFCHIHSTGAAGAKWMPELVKNSGVDLEKSKKIDMREYVHNAPEVLAAADLVLCRAGAMTVSELCAAGVPAIIVPSPNVADNHQLKNARALSDKGAALCIEERDLDPGFLYRMIKDLLADPARLEAMRRSALALAVFDAKERIFESVEELLSGK